MWVFRWDSCVFRFVIMRFRSGKKKEKENEEKTLRHCRWSTKLWLCLSWSFTSADIGGGDGKLLGLFCCCFFSKGLAITPKHSFLEWWISQCVTGWSIISITGALVTVKANGSTPCDGGTHWEIWHGFTTPPRLTMEPHWGNIQNVWPGGRPRCVTAERPSWALPAGPHADTHLEKVNLPCTCETAGCWREQGNSRQ